eukprot:1187884-Prorocentrum_minimum.AAC.6
MDIHTVSKVRKETETLERRTCRGATVGGRTSQWEALMDHAAPGVAADAVPLGVASAAEAAPLASSSLSEAAPVGGAGEGAAGAALGSAATERCTVTMVIPAATQAHAKVTANE